MSIDTTKKIKQVTYNGTEIPLRGYDTSDANVTKHDLPLDITAYGPNGKVEGFVDTYGPNESVGCPFNSMTYNSSNKTIAVKGDLGTPIMFRNGCSTIVSVGGDKFGDATAADVAKGKTFTSAAGLKVVGTAEGSSAADVTFDLYNNGFANLVAVYMSKTDGVMDTTIPNSDHRSITTIEGSMVVLINQDFNGDSIDLVPDNGVHIAQGWRMENVTMFVAGAETNGMNIDVNIA